MNKIDMVIPVIVRDVRRLRLFLRSLERNWHAGGEVFVIVPFSDLDAFRWAASTIVRLVAKEELVYTPKKVFGWYMQMMEKLAASNIVGTDTYLAIDADCMVAKPLTYGDCFRGGKMLAAIGKEDRYRFRIAAWVNAARLLKLPQSLIPPASSLYTIVCPFFYARDLVRGMKERIEQATGKSWIDALSDAIPEQHRHVAWTEASVYHLHVLATGTWASRYVGVPEFTHQIGIGSCTPAEAERDFWAWKPEDTFEHEMFCNIQSTGQIAEERVEAKVAPWMGTFS